MHTKLRLLTFATCCAGSVHASTPWNWVEQGTLRLQSYARPQRTLQQPGTRPAALPSQTVLHLALCARGVVADTAQTHGAPAKKDHNQVRARPLVDRCLLLCAEVTSVTGGWNWACRKRRRCCAAQARPGGREWLSIASGGWAAISGRRCRSHLS